MSLTLDEIVEHQGRLRREIVERECLLAAFDVLHGYFADGQGPKSIELGSLVSALASASPVAALPSTILELPAAPAVMPRPSLPRERPYEHPELVAIGARHGCNVQRVRWAIERMTEDYSLHDLATLLEREGRPMKSSEISVVLTRLRSRGEIEEITRSHGPIPAVFRKPVDAAASETSPADLADGCETMTESAVAI